MPKKLSQVLAYEADGTTAENVSLESVRLKTITAYELHEALHAIGAPPGLALRDPVACMRYVASADVWAIQRALRAVLAPGYDLPEDRSAITPHVPSSAF